MKITRHLIVLLLTAAVVISCNDDDEDAAPTGLLYSYFPVNVGHEMIYDVSWITKDEFSGEEDTAVFQIREVVESVFTDNQGRPTQRLERYKRLTPNDPWVIHNVWTSNLTATQALKYEDNITYVKLIFPAATGSTWNGNAMNTMDPQEYEYTELNVPGTVNGISFDSTLTVLQLDDDNFIYNRFEMEQYAAGVGCIYKEVIYIKKNTTVPPFTGIVAQSKYIEKIVSWNN